MTAISAPVPGQSFGPFAIESVVGVGGMGIVYRARDTARGGLVALKLLRAKDGAPPTDEERARFVREARLASGLLHPNIVQILASGAVGTIPYIAMEWIEGLSLALAMGDASVPIAARLDVLAGIAEALVHAHANGVVHRDLKPTNVMVDRAGTPKLVDFGIAKQSRDASRPLALAHTEAGVPLATRTGVFLGTPSYMAPEQMLSPEVDARVDQFAWGVLAYELLAGIHPRDTVAHGDAAFPVGRAKPLAWQEPSVPEPVAAIVHRAMAYERDARFPTMADLAASLRVARGSSTTPSGPAGAQAFSLGMPLTSPTGPALLPAYGAPTTMEGVASRLEPSGPVTGATPRRGAALLASIALVLLVVIGIGLFSGSSLLAGSGAPVPPPIPGIRTVELVRGFEDVPFAGGASGTAKAVNEVHRGIRPCIDSRMLADDDIKVEAELDPSGKITHVESVNYCRREYGNHYLCTYLGDPVKRGHPTPPPDMLECVREATKALVLPPLVPRRKEKYEPASMPEPMSIDLDLEAR